MFFASDIPNRIGGRAVFVADRFDVRSIGTPVQDDRPGLQSANQGDDRIFIGPRIDLLSIWSGDSFTKRVAIGIEPDDDDFAVVGEQFTELLQVFFQIGIAIADQQVVSRPIRPAALKHIRRRAIDAERHCVFAAGVGDFANDVALAAFPRRVANAMLGRFRRPEAESIMVFRGKDEMFRPPWLSPSAPTVPRPIGSD